MTNNVCSSSFPLLDRRPIVTCAGELEVFSTFEEELTNALPIDSCEWRRTLGRPVRNVHIGANFAPYSASLLPKPNQWDLIRLPLFHIYWTECNDVDLYKSGGGVKEDIEAWIKELTAKEINDWLIVVVENYDGKRTNKLLPRTTVLDKIRTDFAPKQGDRCISCIVNTGSSSINQSSNKSKSADSFNGLVSRIRHLLLVAYAKAVSKLEDYVRQQREKRNEPDWNFVKYFRLQEELAQVLEMLRLYDEALVQYDELDALFSQFVVNRDFKNNWLENFQKPLEKWHGLSLNSAAANGLIDKDDPSLLELRAYLFSKQAQMLLKIGKPWEMAGRCLPFLHTCTRELNLLEITAPKGAVNCWLFLASMEVLQMCDKHNQADQVEAYSLHTACLWAYSSQKLRELGVLCGLMPGDDGGEKVAGKIVAGASSLVPPAASGPAVASVSAATPSSEQLHLVVLLSAGMGDNPGEAGSPSPTDKLKEALCSKAYFNKTYLELAELAMGTYKHIGRLRSARLIGREVASFYLLLGEIQTAAAFLSDAVKTFEQDGWKELVAQTQIELSECHKRANDWKKYVQICAQISAAPEIDNLIRLSYFQEMNKYSKQLTKDTNLRTQIKDLLKIINVKLLNTNKQDKDDNKVIIINSSTTNKGLVNNLIEVEVEIESNFPKELLLEEGVFLSLEIDAAANKSSNKSNLLQSRLKEDKKLKIQKHLDYKEDKSLNSANVVCLSSNNASKTKRSNSMACSQHNQHNLQHYSEFKNSLRSTNNPICLKPGFNSIKLVKKPEEEDVENEKYYLGQLAFKVNENFELISQFLSPKMCVEIKRQEPSVRLDIINVNNKGEELLSGLEQKMALKIQIGSYPVESGLFVKLAAMSRGLSMRKDDDCGEMSGVVEVPVENLDAFSLSEVPIWMLAELPTKEHQVAIYTPWNSNSKPLIVSLSFTPPLLTSWKLYTVKHRKYVQVCVNGQCENAPPIKVELPVLSINEGVKTVDMNINTSQEIVNGMSVSYIWELSFPAEEDNGKEEVPLKADFAIEYSTPTTTCLHSSSSSSSLTSVAETLNNEAQVEKEDTNNVVNAVNVKNKKDDKKMTYHYYFTIKDYQTLYHVDAHVEPTKGNEFCRVGALCHLHLNIKPVGRSLLVNSDVLISARNNSAAASGAGAVGTDIMGGGFAAAVKSLMYEVVAEQSVWAVCGRTAGVISFDSDVEAQDVVLDVMPLTSGNLALPTVRLSKYIPADYAPTSGKVETHPRLQPFSAGQVYNSSKGKQVYVIASAAAAAAATATNTSSTSSMNMANNANSINQGQEQHHHHQQQQQHLPSFPHHQQQTSSATMAQ